MISLSLQHFPALAGGDAAVCTITFIASCCGMFVRQEVGHRNFNPLVNFAVTAFVTTLISSQAVILQFSNAPFTAIASSVLMLVPGFPLINAVADMLKGYINMGIARFFMASLLTFATCLRNSGCHDGNGDVGMGEIMDFLIALLTDMSLAAIPAVGFVLVFNVSG